MSDRDIYSDADELLLGPAAELVGVHPATLRRWADAGRVPVARTPTNQRRFRVGDLRRLVLPELHSAPGDEPAADDDAESEQQLPVQFGAA